MFKITHTPGPWSTSIDRACVYSPLLKVEVKSPTNPICQLPHHDTSWNGAQRQWGDACLISAAPELLHALKWAAEFISLHTGDGAGWTGVQYGPEKQRFFDDDGNADYEAMREFLKATISRATGTKDAVAWFDYAQEYITEDMDVAECRDVAKDYLHAYVKQCPHDDGCDAWHRWADEQAIYFLETLGSFRAARRNK